MSFQGLGAKQAKHSSVKKLLLAALVLELPENYDTVKLILDNLKLEGIEYMTQADLKLLMILVGKSGGRPKYGCPFCDASYPFMADGELYCLNDLLNHHKHFVDAGANHKRQQDFQNVVHPPLIIAANDQLILGVLAPPELHMLIGVTAKLISGIEDNVFPTKEEGEKFMDNFLKQVLNFKYLT